LARFFLRLQEAGRVLAASADDVLAFDDLETARYEAERGAKGPADRMHPQWA
jgi:hypothetical protein